MKRNIIALAAAGIVLIHHTGLAQFAASVVAYERGTGFAANFTNANAALGAPASGASVTPYAPPFSTSQIVSIGAGGFLSLQLNTPISDDPNHLFGIDFLLFGNSFFVVTNGSGANGITSGSVFSSSVSTRVEVSRDGSIWYTLDAALAPTVGTYFPTDGTGNPFLAVNPALAAGDFAGRNLSGIRSLYAGSAGGGGYDLSWARDGDGNPVELESVSYVRIDVLSGRTQIDAITVVAEPHAWVIAAFGLMLLWTIRRAMPRFEQVRPSAGERVAKQFESPARRQPTMECAPRRRIQAALGSARAPFTIRPSGPRPRLALPN